MDRKEYLKEIERVIEEGEFKDNWNSLSSFTPPSWFVNAKFGIFIHWGIYSVYGIAESWSFYNGGISYGDYMKQCEGFTAKNYDPKAWAELYKKAGARYAVLTTKHHDGLCMFKSDYTDCR